MESTKQTPNHNAGILIIVVALAVIAILVYCGVPVWAPIINIALVLPVIPITIYLRRRNSPNLRKQLLVLICVGAGVAGFLTPLLLHFIERGR